MAGTSRSRLTRSPTSSREHREEVYANRAPDAVSWYQPRLEQSLAEIDRWDFAPSAHLVDEAVVNLFEGLGGDPGLWSG